jgi:hypothetical protein
VSGALHVFDRRRYQLLPSAGVVAAEIWGHRLVRYTVGPFAHLALVGVALRRVRYSKLARLFLLGHVAAGWALAREGGRMARAADLGEGEPLKPLNAAEAAAAGAGQVLFLQGVALGGVARFLRGDRRTQWATIER